MRMGGEAFFLLNAGMDALALWIAGRICALPAARGRMLCAALGGALYAVAAVYARWLRTAAAVCAAAGVMALIAFGFAPWRTLLKAWLALLVSGLLLAGAADRLMALGVCGAGLLALTALLGAAAAALMRRTQQVRVAPLLVRVRRGEKRVTVQALVDTGNLLTDGVSGLPVAVMGVEALRPLLPEGLAPARLETLPPGFRLVAARTASGRRLMMCFRPDALEIKTRRGWAPRQAMIAVADTNCVGRRALLPAALQIDKEESTHALG